MRGMEALVDDGRVRFVGVSNFSIRDLKNAEAALSKHLIIANQCVTA
jgi:diketogulonate reductase-like aldo/keto reductase